MRTNWWDVAFLVALIVYINAVHHDLGDPWQWIFVVVMGFTFAGGRR